jgi:hypothetical protein
MLLSTRITEIFIIETDKAENINTLSVLTDATESKLPVVWKNYGQYRLVPALVLAEAIRLYDQWLTASDRMPGVYTFNGILHWDDCMVLNDMQIKLLLGEDGPKESHDTGTDNTDA